jgi:hypothetical protein
MVNIFAFATVISRKKRDIQRLWRAKADRMSCVLKKLFWQQTVKTTFFLVVFVSGNNVYHLLQDCGPACWPAPFGMMLTVLIGRNRTHSSHSS